MSLFVDTSAWYAVASTGDRNDRRAKELLVDGRILTDHVLVETWRLIAHRLSPRHAERWWGGIRGGVAENEVVGEADLACA